MELAQVVNQENCNVPFVRKFFQKPDVLIVICLQIAVTACSSIPLQRVDHNELCGWMLC